MSHNIIKMSVMVAILMSVMAMSAQSLPAEGVKVHQPKALLAPLVSMKTSQNLKNNNWGQNDKPNEYKHWTVYSDRADNVAYSNLSTSSSKVGTLKFNEEVRIADIQNNFGLVYREPKKGVPYPQISEKAEVVGWVPMDKLLLWQSCPVNENEIYQKALLVANLDQVSGDNSAELGNAYDNPETKKVKGGIKTDMTFYFVMKTDPSGMVLLSRQSRMDGSSNEVLYGWVNKNSYTPWNQRSCLEPNWNPKDVAALNSPVGKKYHFYGDPNLTKVGSNYQYGVENGDDKSPATKYRMDPYKTRFPILDNDTQKNDIYKVTTFGGGGRSVNAAENNADADVKRKIEELTNKLQNINIIFVIDGTSSMKPYFQSAKDALKKGLLYFDKQYHPKVGAVIYRDYADGNAMIEMQPLVPANDVRLHAFLDNIGRLGYGANSSPNDHTHTEALYAGIDAALSPSKMGYTAEQANLIIVIGDCGNAIGDNKFSESDLVKRLVDNNVQLMSYQVKNSDAEAWTQFNTQLSRLIKQNLDGQYAKLKGVDVKVKFNKLQSGIGYDVKSSSDKRNPFVGSMRRAQNLDKSMDPNELSHLIENNIGDFSSAIQDQIDALIAGTKSDFGAVGYVKGEDNSDVMMDDAFVRSRIGEALYNKLKAQKVTMTFTGYTAKADPQGRAYWKPVVFLSSAELDNLIARLKPVYDASSTENRRPYVEAIKGLMQAMVPDITNDQLNDMDISEVSKRIAGLNEASAAVKTHTLAEIQEPKAVSNVEFTNLVNDFKKKFEKVQQIRTSKYKYAYEINNTKYYWIPVEDLP